MIHRHPRWLLCVCACVVLAAASLPAQAPRRSPTEVGQIIELALQAVVAPQHGRSTHTAPDRAIRFDFARTLAAFGYADDSTTRASLRLANPLAAGSDSLLVDCDQLGRKKCSALVQSAYVSVQPISISNSDAVVRVSVIWATPMSMGTFMSGASTEVILSRSGSGAWKFVRIGNGVVS
jgi:hypothetical protein